MPGQRASAAPSVRHPSLAEQDQAEACAAAALRVTATLVVVTGITGVGTSTWLQQFVAATARQSVIAVSADRFEEQFAFGFVDKLAHGAGHRSGVLGTSTAPDIMSVGRDLVAALTAGGRRRVCLVIDNAQWIDRESLQVLRYALARLARSGVTMAIAGQAPRTSAAAALMVADPAEWQIVQTVRLRPLTAVELRRYVTEAHSRDISLRLADRIRASTGGLPVLIDAVVAGMEKRSAGPRWEDDIDLPDMPGNPFSSWQDESTPDIRGAVRIASVLRDPVTRDEIGRIAEALGQSADVDGAVAAGLLVDSDDGLRPFHELYAAEAASDIDAAERMRLHSIAAATLRDPHRAFASRLAAAENVDDELRARLHDLADDAVSTHRESRAIDYLRATAALCTGEERDHLIVEACLLAASALLSPSVTEFIPDLERMKPHPVRDLALLMTKRITEGLAWSAEYASELSSTPIDHPDDLLLRMNISMMAVMIQLTAGDRALTLDLLDETIGLASRMSTATRLPHDGRLRPLADASAVLLRCRGLAVVVSAGMGDVSRVLSETESLSAAIAAATDSPALVDALTCRAGAFVARGRIRAAVVDLDRALVLAAAGHLGWSLGHTRIVLAYCFWVQGRYEAAREMVDVASSSALEYTDVPSRPLTYLFRALVAATAGDAPGHAAALATAARVTVAPYDTFGTELALLAVVEHARSLQRWQDVLDALEPGKLAERRLAGRSILSYRIDALAALGRAEEADRELRPLRITAGTDWTPVYGTLDWLEGRVDEAYGLIEPAGRAFLRAAAGEAPPLPSAIARFDAARMHLLIGDRDGGRRLLRAALAEFRTLGAIPYVRRAVDLLDGRSDTPARLADLASLTSREREVALHAASGRTNAEIAHELYLSVPTVRFHMRNVLAKLGISSRRDLASIVGAARHP